MDITLQPYQPELEAAWDDFVMNNRRNATFLHSRKFFLHNPLNATDDASVLFYKKGKIIAVLPAALINQHQQPIFHSHPRATYGGFVTSDSVGVEEALAIVSLTISFAKERGATALVIRNPFSIFHQIPSAETDYAMWYHGFTLKAREIESCIQLQEQPELAYDDSTWRSVKKAVKSVTVQASEDYAAFWQMLTSNLQDRYDRKPTHSLEQFMELKQRIPADQIQLFGAFANDQLIAGIVLFITKPMVLHAQYIASDKEQQQLRPLNAVIDHICRWGWSNGYRYFNLGTANEEGGRVVNSGLFRFKEGFGGRGILRETMHLQL